MNRELLTPLLVLAALAVWCGLQLRHAVRHHVAASPGEWQPPRIPGRVAVAAIAWLTFLIVTKLTVAQPAGTTPSLSAIQFNCVLQLLLVAGLVVALRDGRSTPLSQTGLSPRLWDRQAYLGLVTYLAAIWPTMMLLIATQFWRTKETEHAYLQALAEDAGGEMLAWIAVSAVVVAPLAEELLFRVTLQGWLRQQLPAPAAIGLTALVFVLVHGWYDALPLVPLALILGYVYDRTHGYWTCVAAHSLFNGTFIALALLTK